MKRHGYREVVLGGAHVGAPRECPRKHFFF